MILPSRERVSTALESSGGVLYTTASNALDDHLVMYGLDAAAMETHSMKLPLKVEAVIAAKGVPTSY